MAKGGDAERESEGDQSSPHSHVTQRSKTKERLLDVNNHLECLEDAVFPRCMETVEG